MTKIDLINRLDFESLIKLNYYIKLIKNNKYFIKEDFVRALAHNLTMQECKKIKKNYESDLTIEHISDLFLTNDRPTGNFIKKKFLNFLVYNEIKGKLYNDVIFYEFPVNGKRTDITRINGLSYAYEIKSIRDSFNRFENQIREYSLIFDMVYLISEKYDHIKSKVGIIELIKKNGNIDFRYIKRYKPNKHFNSNKQLNLLQKDELKKIIKNNRLKYHNNRNSLQKEILKNLDEFVINRIFKQTIKERYRPIWLQTLKILNYNKI
jgi:hypothetical protein